MPRAAPRPCTYPRCGKFSLPGNSRCAEHLANLRREQDKKRGDSGDRGYGGVWQKARATFLRQHPLCVRCEQKGLTAAAIVVDHIVAHCIDRTKGEPTAEQQRLFWDTSNWQSLCAACHTSKTKQLDGAAFLEELLVPGWLRPSAIPLTLVCGPPGAGKTRYVADRASALDTVIDLDEIRARVGGHALYQCDDSTLRAGLVERNRLLDRLAVASVGRAWFCLTAPRVSDRNRWRALLKPVEVVVLEVDAARCKERILLDQRRVGHHREHCGWVDMWWRTYSTGFDETVVRAA